MAKKETHRSRGIELEISLWDWLAVQAEKNSRSVNGQVEAILKKVKGGKK